MGAALFPTEDQRRDHFPVLCCMRAERHLASRTSQSALPVSPIGIVDPPPRVYGTHVNVRFESFTDFRERTQDVHFTPQSRHSSARVARPLW
jgi:hypothetical protein